MPSLKNPANGSSLRTPEQQTHAAVLEIYGSGFLWNRGDFANLAETFEGALIVDTGAVSDSSTSSSAPCHSLRVSAGKKNPYARHHDLRAEKSAAPVLTLPTEAITNWPEHPPNALSNRLLGFPRLVVLFWESI